MELGQFFELDNVRISVPITVNPRADNLSSRDARYVDRSWCRSYTPAQVSILKRSLTATGMWALRRLSALPQLQCPVHSPRA